MRIIISGGGTGGHVYPGITVAQALKDRCRGAEIMFIGARTGLEADVVPREGFRLETIELTGLPRKISPRLLTALWLAARGTMAARRLIRDFRPDVVLGTGGYVCGPVVLAAVLAGVPTAIQEQNAFPGLTNRLLGRMVSRVFMGYAEAARYFSGRKAVFTGNPIRASVMAATRRQGAESLEMDADLTTLLVVGASQGARSINQALLSCLPTLLLQPRLQVVHITGPRNYDAVCEAMKRLHLPPAMAARAKTIAYLYNMPDAYALADLVVTRAGAISLAEMTARGLPLILVPFPYAAADHQTYNARSLEKRGAARIIMDRDLTGERLQTEILTLLREQRTLTQMHRASQAAARPQAAAAIVDELLRLADK